ncbi:flotillin-like FloA family protein, partial [bacterium]|nr:flotillin-like FloA family protein [bacterium]
QEGRLGVMDYYNLTNIKADTTMREAIAKPEICKDERDNGFAT